MKNKFSKKTYIVAFIVMLLCITVGFAALNTTLNINGKSSISKNTWDVHFENIVIKDGSVEADKEPTIENATTVDFEAKLNLPGDFYEFTVDVVNSGTIDAMINSIIKTPELTDTQKKYLNYIVEYQNGESINNKQLIFKNSFVRLKVRVEYRTDIAETDLPQTLDTLNLGFFINYVQSDNTGSNVVDNGISEIYIASGDINSIGSKICIDTECFILYKNDGTTLYLISEFNLFVGSKYDNGTIFDYGDEADGLQDSSMLGWNVKDTTIRNGLITFANTNYWSGSSYPSYVLNENSNLYNHIINYKTYLLSKYEGVSEVRLITYEEILELGCSNTSRTCLNYSPYTWIYSITYWTGTAYNDTQMYGVDSNGAFNGKEYTYARGSGIRPVIEIPVLVFTSS